MLSAARGARQLTDPASCLSEVISVAASSASLSDGSSAGCLSLC